MALILKKISTSFMFYIRMDINSGILVWETLSPLNHFDYRMTIIELN